MRIDIVNRDDEIGRERLRRIYQKEWVRAFFIFHPKRNNFIKTVQGIAHPHAAIGYFEIHEIGRDIREKREDTCGEENENGEEDIVEKDACERGAHGDDSERPKPIATTLDVLVLVCAPAQSRGLSVSGHNEYIVSSLFYPRCELRAGVVQQCVREGWRSGLSHLS